MSTLQQWYFMIQATNTTTGLFNGSGSHKANNLFLTFCQYKHTKYSIIVHTKHFHELHNIQNMADKCIEYCV